MESKFNNTDIIFSEIKDNIEESTDITDIIDKSEENKNRKNNQKPRKPHPLLSAVSFFLAVFLTVMFVSLIITQIPDIVESWDDIQAAVPSVEITGSASYQRLLLSFVSYLNTAINDPDAISQNPDLMLIESDMKKEINSGNIIVYAENKKDGTKYSSNAETDVIHRTGIWYENGEFFLVKPSDGGSIQKISLSEDIKSKHIQSLQSRIYNSSFNQNFTNTECKIYVLTSDKMLPYYNEYFGFSAIEHSLKSINNVFKASLAALAVITSLWIYASVTSADRALFNKKTAYVIGKLWIEVKICIYLIAFFSVIGIVQNFLGYSYSLFDEVMETAAAFLAAYWCIYLFVIDIKYSGGACFKRNIIMSIVKLIVRISKMNRVSIGEKPFNRAILKEFLQYLGCMCGLSILFILFSVNFPAASDGAQVFLFFIIITIITLMILFTSVYIHNLKNTLADFAKITDRISDIRYGREIDPLRLKSDSLLAKTASELNDIQGGIKLMVAEQTKSERTKVELVTNVSHDIKTPLTSLVSYTNLLADCPNLPDEAKDYVEILQNKLRRLTELINNLFDLSKATSTEMPVEHEDIDFCKLVNQVAAELDDKIQGSDLKFVYKMPEYPVILSNDGNKLRRVLENLFINSIKYSLEGTRVFITLSQDGNDAFFSIMNISKTEIDYTPEEIMARFSRGDKNRSTEGSGLGLAIARSFTELCGGTFQLELDGDIFKVILSFPKK